MIVLLLIAIVGVGLTIYMSVLRLYKRNRIIVTYFFAEEKIIPTFKDINDTDPRIGALEKANTELLASINSKDWGMSEFFASTLESLVSQLSESR